MTDDPNVQVIHVDPPPRANQEYLGDGVYAEFDGYQIWLYTHDGISRLCEIALEPGVFARLLTYAERLRAERDLDNTPPQA
jgi:hypothetical protein